MGRLILAPALVLGLSVCASACADPTPRAAAQQSASPSRPARARPSTPEPPPPPPAEPLARAHVKIVVLGEFPPELLDAIDRGLRAELEVDVERIEGLPLPRAAYYPPRRRYRADRLLEHLNAHLEGEPETTRVLGLTSVDISTTKGRIHDWGVFGLGELGGRSCVISTFRLSRRARDAAHLSFRVVTTCVHEVGHTLGLPHCTDPLCVMRDAEGSIRTVDESTGRLGPDCLALIERTAPRVLPYRARPPP